MDDPILKALLQEYNQLSSYVNANALTTFKVPPLVFTGAAGLIIYTNPQNLFIGIGVSLAILFMLIWLGFCHTMVNGVGLRLIETEQRINKQTGSDSSSGISFFSVYLSEGTRILPGMGFYYAILFVVISSILILAHINFWRTMTIWQWPILYKLTGTLCPILLNVLVSINMVRVEMKTFREKKTIICRYSESHTQ